MLAPFEIRDHALFRQAALIGGQWVDVHDYPTAVPVLNLADQPVVGSTPILYGQNMSRVWRLMEALEFGIVGIDSGAVSTKVAPFGGVKQSCAGRAGGSEGLREFTELKYVCIGGI